MSAAPSPDFLEPVVGYRAWSLSDEGELVPWTLVSAGAWAPGVNTAACHIKRFASDVGDPSPSRGRRHRPPAADCMCGLYALNDATDPRIAPSRTGALGAIVAWGDIEVHATGFRAEHACVVALALPAGAARGEVERLQRAAARYRVPLVPQSRLVVAAHEHGAPLPAFSQLPDRRRPGVGLGQRPPWASRPADLAPGGAVGFDFRAHVWVETAIDHAVVGITEAFAGLLGDDPAAIRVTAQPAGSVVAAGDVLARIGAHGRTYLVWAPVGGVVRETAARPERLLAAPEGAGWLATIEPSAWDHDRNHLRWGPDARAAYRVDASFRGAGADPFADVRAERITALPRVRSGTDVLAQLRAARERDVPRFADTAELYDRLGVDLGCSLHDDPRVAARLRRLDTTVALELSEPAARLTLELRDGGPRLALGATAATADLTLSCTAEDAHRLLRGDLDAPAALRRGELRSTAAEARTLAVLSVLKGLQRGYARRATPDPGPNEIAARRLGLVAG